MINFPGSTAGTLIVGEGLGEDPKAVADQLGHGLVVNIETYTTTPPERRRPGVNRLADALRIM